VLNDIGDLLFQRPDYGKPTGEGRAIPHPHGAAFHPGPDRTRKNGSVRTIRTACLPPAWPLSSDLPRGARDMRAEMPDRRTR